MIVYDLAQEQWNSADGCADLVQHFEQSTYKAEAEAIVADMVRQQARRTRIVDLGCGPGRYAEALAGLYEQYTGYDTSQHLLAEAQAAHGQQDDVRFVLRDIIQGADYTLRSRPNLLLSIDTSRHYHDPLGLLLHIVENWPAYHYLFSVLHGPTDQELINGRVLPTALVDELLPTLGVIETQVDQYIEGDYVVRYALLKGR